MLRSPHRYLLATLCGLLLSGCLPYVVGSTAQTVKRGEMSESASVYGAHADSAGKYYGSVDLEFRVGLSQRSDLGIRVTGASGLVLDYKHRLTSAESTTAVALGPGVGVVNFGTATLANLTLLVSREARPDLTPYGGVRVMRVGPTASDSATARHTAGAFLGLRLGESDRGIAPELGFYYDGTTSPLGNPGFTLVPSLTVNSRGLLRSLFRALSRSH